MSGASSDPIVIDGDDDTSEAQFQMSQQLTILYKGKTFQVTITAIWKETGTLDDRDNGIWYEIKFPDGEVTDLHERDLVRARDLVTATNPSSSSSSNNNNNTPRPRFAVGQRVFSIDTYETGTVQGVQFLGGAYRYRLENSLVVYDENDLLPDYTSESGSGGGSSSSSNNNNNNNNGSEQPRFAVGQRVTVRGQGISGTVEFIQSTLEGNGFKNRYTLENVDGFFREEQLERDYTNESGSGGSGSSSSNNNNNKGTKRPREEKKSFGMEEVCSICWGQVLGNASYEGNDGEVVNTALSATEEYPTQNKRKIVICLSCGNPFHDLCLLTSVKKGNLACPQCRAPITISNGKLTGVRNAIIVEKKRENKGPYKVEIVSKIALQQELKF
tara:strand:- start:310 stop:1467 length:1158 start_codon:yes stop_codon:yes gene_type:complete